MGMDFDKNYLIAGGFCDSFLVVVSALDCSMVNGASVKASVDVDIL